MRSSSPGTRIADVPEPVPTLRLGDDLAWQRLRHRMRRLDRVLAALEQRAQGYDTPPRALRLAMDDFRGERDRLRARCERMSAPDSDRIAV